MVEFIEAVINVRFEGEACSIEETSDYGHFLSFFSDGLRFEEHSDYSFGDEWVFIAHPSSTLNYHRFILSLHIIQQRLPSFVEYHGIRVVSVHWTFGVDSIHPFHNVVYG